MVSVSMFEVNLSVAVYPAEQEPAGGLERVSLRTRCVPTNRSASWITFVADPTLHPTPIFKAASSAAWSASCCSWLRCHSTEPVSRISAAEPMSATSHTATMIITCPDVLRFPSPLTGEGGRQAALWRDYACRT